MRMPRGVVVARLALVVGAAAFPTTTMAVLIAASLALTVLSVYLGLRLVPG